MNKYSSLEEIPLQFNMVNKVSTSGELKTDSSCQPSFTYFQGGSEPKVVWGSDKPMKEVCPIDYKPHSGIPNHSIWNNMTKRKSVVLN
jgi:hypothetical protein|tara:strand:+ start:206 stop:469 length:264 start_codon:yes stop_codon:yes gene_type:complete